MEENRRNELEQIELISNKNACEYIIKRLGEELEKKYGSIVEKPVFVQRMIDIPVIKYKETELPTHITELINEMDEAVSKVGMVVNKSDAMIQKSGALSERISTSLHKVDGAIDRIDSTSVSLSSITENTSALIDRMTQIVSKLNLILISSEKKKVSLWDKIRGK